MFKNFIQIISGCAAIVIFSNFSSVYAQSYIRGQERARLNSQKILVICQDETEKENLVEPSPVCLRREMQEFHEVSIHDVSELDGSFRGSVIHDWSCECPISENCDFTDTWFGSGELRGLSQKQLVSTRNFTEKNFPLSVWGKLRDLDLKDFQFSNGDLEHLDVSGSNLENVRFTRCRLPKLTDEQLRQTWNYRVGNFTGIQFCNELQWKKEWNENNITLENAWNAVVFGGRSSHTAIQIAPNADISDSVFILCDLSTSSGLTLEQVKSTWNYKTGHLSIVRWPKHIEEVLKTEAWEPVFQAELTDPQGRFYSPVQETFCIRGDASRLSGNEPQPNFYFEDAALDLTVMMAQCLNFQHGIFLQSRFLKETNTEWPNFMKVTNFQKTAFVGCKFENHFTGFGPEFTKIDLTDCVFIDCDLTESKNLSFEQVKKTWNYKAGRMSLCKWPEYIEKALEEEEKAKAQEEKK